ncbi:hypothetical protein G6F56_001109 [Rhizopus delemar]|nr:hypothetical protein G6F56_001109 [Rhizopus delemar]
MGLFSKLKPSSPNYNSGPPPYTERPSNNYAPPSPPQQYNENPDKRPMPQGWISQYDPNSRKFFYVYTPTSLRQWEHPSDKQMNMRGESNAYYQQHQQQQPYLQQPYQQSYSSYQQPMMQQQQASRFGSGGNMGYGKMAAAGLGGGLLGFMVGDAIGDASHPDVINYYDNDYNNYDGGGFDGGGMDGGFDQVDF